MNLLSTVFGYAGTLCLVLSFQFRKERTLFVCQMLSGLLFVLHYGLAGDYTGMLMDGMCFVRSLMMASGKKALTGKPAMLVLCAVIVALGALSWDGLLSLFPTVALLASTAALFTGKGDVIRRTQLFCTSPSWLIYNIYVSSWPGVICETLDMGSVIVYYFRRLSQSKKKK